MTLFREMLGFGDMLLDDNLHLVESLYILHANSRYSYKMTYWTGTTKCTSQVATAKKDASVVTADMISNMINLKDLHIKGVEDIMCIDLSRNKTMTIDIDNCPNITFINRD